MKFLIFLIYAAIAMAVIESCKKPSSNIRENDSSIMGTWELRQGVAQVGTINYAPGNGSRLVFTDAGYSTTNASYKFFVQGNHAKKGQYQLVADRSANTCTGLVMAGGQFTGRIILDKDTTNDKVFYQITNNKLVILSGYFPSDGGAEMTYEKQ